MGESREGEITVLVNRCDACRKKCLTLQRRHRVVAIGLFTRSPVYGWCYGRGATLKHFHSQFRPSDIWLLQ